MFQQAHWNHNGTVIFDSTGQENPIGARGLFLIVKMAFARYPLPGKNYVNHRFDRHCEEGALPDEAIS